MGFVFWQLVGLVLFVAISVMVGCVLGAGELRGGLEAWAELVMRVVTLGRWNPAQEEADE